MLIPHRRVGAAHAKSRTTVSTFPGRRCRASRTTILKTFPGARVAVVEAPCSFQITNDDADVSKHCVAAVYLKQAPSLAIPVHHMSYTRALIWRFRFVMYLKHPLIWRFRFLPMSSHDLNFKHAPSFKFIVYTCPIFCRFRFIIHLKTRPLI